MMDTGQRIALPMVMAINVAALLVLVVAGDLGVRSIVS
jgi:hypothetical protein